MTNSSRFANIILWVVQGLLAALYLLTGTLKLLLPLAALIQQSHLPGLFIRFIGFAEVIGALGLVLPGLLRIRTFLIPVAATCLFVIMVGAVVLTLEQQPPATHAILPFVTGCLDCFVAYGRWRLAPLPSSRGGA